MPGDDTMSKKATYAELAKKVKALEKTESTLRESEELYRSLFENAPIGIGIADRNGNLIDFNESVLKPHLRPKDCVADLR